jgi:hypothetical protein
MPSSSVLLDMLQAALAHDSRALKVGGFTMNHDLRLPQAGEGYDGSKAGNLGLRKNTATSYTDLLRVVFAEAGGIVGLLRLHFEIAHGEKLDDDSDKDDALRARLESLTARRGPHTPATPQLRGRSLQYRAALSDRIARSVGAVDAVGALQFLDAYASPRNPNLTVAVRLPPFTSQHYLLDKAAHQAWVNLVLSFFGGTLNQLSAQQTDQGHVHCTRRQSFGFLRPTLTDTGESFRLSLGIQPPTYGRIVVAALHQVDAAIAALRSGTMQRALFIVEDKGKSGAGDRITRYLASDDHKMIAYRVAESFAATKDLNGFVAWIAMQDELQSRSPSTTTKPEPLGGPLPLPPEGTAPSNPVDDEARVRAERIAKLQTDAPLFDDTNLATPEVSDPEAALNLFDQLDDRRDDRKDEDPIWHETLERVVDLALDTLGALGDLRQALERAALKRTLRWLVTRVVNNVKKGQVLLTAKLEETHLYTKAVVVIEDLLELLLALRSLPELTRTEPDHQPEPNYEPKPRPKGKDKPTEEEEEEDDDDYYYYDDDDDFDDDPDGGWWGQERRETKERSQREGKDDKARAEWKKSLPRIALRAPQQSVQIEQRVTRDLQAQFNETHLHVYRTDSGEQAGVASMLALVNARKLDTTDPGLGTWHPYFELPKFLKHSDLYVLAPPPPPPSVDPPSTSGVDGTPPPERTDPQPSRSPRNEIGQLVDLNPYHTARPESEPSRPPLQQQQRSPGYAWIVDITNSDPTSPEVKQLVTEWQIVRESDSAVRLILFASLLKHDEFGLDKLQAGRIIVLGDPMPALDALHNSARHPVLDDFLSMIYELSEGPDPQSGGSTSGWNHDKDEVH